MGSEVRVPGAVLGGGAGAAGVVEERAEVVVLDAADPGEVIDDEPGERLALVRPHDAHLARVDGEPLGGDHLEHDPQRPAGVHLVPG